jgi:hypothetical protein
MKIFDDVVVTYIYRIFLFSGVIMAIFFLLRIFVAVLLMVDHVFSENTHPYGVNTLSGYSG